MKVKEFIKQEICVDVVDDVCEELYIAFDGPLELTDKGKRHFSEVLNYEITLNQIGWNDIVGIVAIDDPDDSVWEARLEKAKEFFESAAGYCADSDYKKWFKET